MDIVSNIMALRIVLRVVTSLNNFYHDHALYLHLCLADNRSQLVATTSCNVELNPYPFALLPVFSTNSLQCLPNPPNLSIIMSLIFTLQPPEPAASLLFSLLLRCEFFASDSFAGPRSTLFCSPPLISIDPSKSVSSEAKGNTFWLSL